MRTKIFNSLFFLLVFTAFLGINHCPDVRAAPLAPIRVLLFSGQNNHDWKHTTPKLVNILTASGRFHVEVTERPDQCKSNDFARCDVIICNWNAWGKAPVQDWPTSTREAFLNFVRRGGGHVVVHAGSSSFYDWPEYQQLAGASWKLGQTNHGPPHEFTVQPGADHPVTRGLSSFQTKDELWLQPGVQPAAQVTATGDGQPLVFSTTFGQGRGFTLLLGHSADFMDTPGFQTLLLRGTEWAATGKVTIRGVEGAQAIEPDDLIKRVATWRFGDDRQSVLALEQHVLAVSANPSEKSQLAAKLAAALTGEATVEGKRRFCEGLSLIGSAAEVPVLARMLSDTNLLFHARQALERIPGDEATAALQAALTTAPGPVRASLIQSFATRRTERTVPDLTRYLADADRNVAGAAIDALGQLGGVQSARALESALNQVAPELRERLAVALLRCANSLQSSGKTTEAAALFAKLVAPTQPVHIRLAAYPAYVATAGKRGSERVLAALTGSDSVLHQAALRALRANRQPALLRAAVDRLANLPSELQEAIITLCGERGGPAVLPALIQAASSTDDRVKQAAIKSLGAIGDGTAAAPLMQLIGTATDDGRKTIAESLARLRGAGTEATLIAALQQSSPVVQTTLIQALVRRDAHDATAALLQAGRSGDAAVRREAISALGKLAEAKACGPMIRLLEKTTESDRATLEAALTEVCRRDPAATSAVVNALPQTAANSQRVLLNVLGSVGGTAACTAVRGQLKSGDAETRLAAVRVLVDWPDAEPLDDLATLIETTSDAKLRTLAARGLNRMAAQAPRRAGHAAEALAKALAAATEVGDQQYFLAALAALPSVPSLQAARTLLRNPSLGGEAMSALLGIAEVIYPRHSSEVKAALANLLSANPAPALIQRAEALAAKLDLPANLAIGGLATSPDGLEKDGAASGDQAAIDGDPKTYWDEADNQKLYVLRVQLRERSTVGCLRILGWTHHKFAPKDFEILCDKKVVKKVSGAVYENNLYQVAFPPVQCDTVELRITGYYGGSPAIRELEIFEKTVAK